MAYSNWGGFVYCNEKPLHDHCDATPRQVLGMQPEYISYMQHFVESIGHDPFSDMYHAVVGDAESGILICLRKSYIAAIITFDDSGQPTFPEHSLGRTDDWDADSGTFRVGSGKK